MSLLRTLRRQRSRTAPGRAAFRLEPLEPRLLLSADPLGALAIDVAADFGAGDHDLSLAVEQLDQTAEQLDPPAEAAAPTRIVRLVDRETSQALSWQLLGSTSEIVVHGGAGADRLTLDDSVLGLGIPVLFDGGAGDDTLVGPGGDSLWRIDGDGTGEVAGVAFAGIENLEGAADNRDTFVFEAEARLAGVVAGGDRGFDSLVFEGGDYARVELVATAPDAGSVSLDGNTVVYAGMEPLATTGTAADTVFTATDGSDDITVSFDAMTSMIVIDSPSFEQTSIPVPTGSLTIEAGDGDDTITVTDLGTFAGRLVVYGGAGNDRLDLAPLPGAVLVQRGDGTAFATNGAVEIDHVTGVEVFTNEAVLVSEQGVPQWLEQGPGVSANGQVENIPPNDPVAGAVQAIAAHPFDPDVIFVGATNGGVWRTTDGGAHWTPLTDQFPSLSIGDVTISPLDSSGNPVDASTPLDDLVVFAGTGGFSNSGVNGFNVGLLRSTDGGSTWSLDAAPELAGLAITSVVPTRTSGVVLVSALDQIVDGTVRRRGGVFRSTDGGVTFTNLSESGGAGALGRGPASDLVLDVTDMPANDVLYAGVVGQGVLRSDDAGATWSLVNGGGAQAFVSPAGANRIVLSVSDADGAPQHPLFAALIFQEALLGATPTVGDSVIAVSATSLFQVGDRVGLRNDSGGGLEGGSGDPNGALQIVSIDAAAGTLTLSRPLANAHSAGTVIVRSSSRVATDIYRSADTGTTWAQLDMPGDGGIGLNPGGQALKNFSLLADRNDSNVVYAGGDRQDLVRDATGTPIGFTSGATNYTARIFRGDASQASGSQWTPIVSSGANATAPHADSREMVFDANGDILEGDDGGIYRLTDVDDAAARQWESALGDLRITEVNALAFDAVSDVLLVGNQDTGSSGQQADLEDPVDLDGDGIPDDFATRFEWEQLNQGDGNTNAVAQIDDITTVRYWMGNNFKSLQRQRVVLGAAFPKESVALDGLGQEDRRFSGFAHIPYVVNAVDPTKMAIGFNSLYESDDGLATVDELQSRSRGTQRVSAIAYGGRDAAGDHADVLYASRGNTVFVREADAARTTDFAARVIVGAGTIVDLVLDPTEWRTAYAIDSSDVYRTTDAGVTWEKVSANLPTGKLGSLELATTDAGVQLLLVGSTAGVHRARVETAAGDFSWSELGRGLPNAPVADLLYVDRDGAPDLLFAGTHGRSAFSLTLTDDVVSGQETLTTQSRIDVIGSAGDDAFAVRRVADNASLLEVVVNGLVVSTVPLSSLEGVSFFGGAGNDTLLVDATDGAIALSGGIDFDGESGTNEVVLEGGRVADELSRTVASVTTVTIHDRFSGAEQRVAVSNAAITDNLDEPAISVFGGSLRKLSQLLDRAVPSTSNEIALLGGSLPLALSGTSLSLAKPVGTPAPGSPQVFGLLSEQGSILARIFESGSDGFRLEDLLDIDDPDALRQALDDLDGDDGNVSYTATGATTLFDVEILKTLSGQADLDVETDLFGGSIGLSGLLDVSVDVALALRIGVDADGFFVDTSTAGPEIVASNFQVAGDVDAGGQFGFLKVELTNAALQIDPGVAIEFDLFEPGGGDGRLRLSEMTDALDFVGLSVARDPASTQDLVFTADVEAAALIEGLDAPFTLLDSQLQFTWADVTDVAGVELSVVGGLGDDLRSFLDFDAQEMLDNLVMLRDQLVAFDADVPFVERGLDALIDTASIFQERILDPLSVSDGTGSVFARFPTVQDLVNSIAGATGFEPETLGLELDTDAASDTFLELTYHVNLVANLVGLQEELGFDFDLESGLADVDFNALAGLDVDVLVEFDVGVDLQEIAAAVSAGETPDFLDSIFLRNGMASGVLTLTAANVDAGARFGFVDVRVVGGSGVATPTLTAVLLDPGTSAADGRTSIQELIDNLANPDALLDAEFSGMASFTLPLAVPFLGITSPIAATTVGLAIPDLSDPTGIEVTGPSFEDLLNFDRMTAGSFVSLLGQVSDWLEGVRQSDLVANFDLPFVSDALNGVFDLADAFSDALLFDDLDLDARGVADLRRLGFPVQAFAEDGVLVADAAPADFENDTEVEIVLANTAFLVSGAMITFDRTTNTITRAAGSGSFLDEGFQAGQRVRISGTGSNDGVFTLGSNTGDVTDLVLVLDPAEQIEDGEIVGARIETASPEHVVVNVTIPAGTGLAGVAAILDAAVGAGVTVSDDGEKLVFTAGTGALELQTGIPKLLDANGDPTFVTAQQLSDRLLELFGISGLAYDADSNELTYQIDFEKDLFQLGVPLDFGFELGPIGSIQTLGSPTLALGGSAGFRMTLGVDLGEPAPSEMLTGGTALTDLVGVEDLTDVVKNEYALTSEPSSALLADDAVLAFDGAEISGNPNLRFAGNTITRLVNSSTSDPAGSFASDGFQAGQTIEVQGSESNDGVYQILSVSPDGATLTLTTAVADEGGATGRSGASLQAFNTIVRTGGTTTWADDGFVVGQAISVSGSAAGNNGNFVVRGITGGVLTLERADAFELETGAEDVRIRGGAVVRLPGDASFVVDAPLLDESPITVTVLAQHDAATPFGSDTSDNKTMLDLSMDVMSALREAGLRGKIRAETAGSQIVLTAAIETKGTPEITFDAAARGLQRSDGSWLEDGFRDGMTITVAGSSRNDGRYTIASVSDDVLTLVGSDSVLAESASGIDVTATFAFSITPDAAAQASLGLRPPRR